MPPVNSFLSGADDIARETKHPLALVFCGKCSHVQLTHMLDPKDVFVDYIYFSSMSETIVQWGKTLAARYAKEFPLEKNDVVAELASNDGCILKPFKSHARIVGVEPAKNIAEVANKDGVHTHAEFFNLKFAKTLRETEGRARLVMARNVLAHVPEVVDFVKGVAHWLTEDGIFHVEAPYLAPMVDHLEFDTIYHEHLSYFSVTALNHLFKAAGLVLWDVEEIGLHGGSLIARGKLHGPAKPSVQAYLDKERAEGLTAMPRLMEFAKGTERLKTEIPSFLGELKNQGRRVAAYGAAAKGVVLTNYCNIGRDQLAFVADRSPYKQGKLTPGMHLPVVAPSEIMVQRPDDVLVLAWNFFDEIAKQLSDYSKAGGRFILPVPKPTFR